MTDQFEAIDDMLKRALGTPDPADQTESSLCGVWLPEKSRKPEHEGLHGRICMVRWARKTWFTTTAELEGKTATVSSQWMFTAPDGAKIGDVYQPVQDAQNETGDTDGVAAGEGYDVPFGGMCPVQGDGVIDGHPCYYRSRGKGWSLEIYPVGGSLETTPAIFEYGEGCYVWPDGGYVRPELSVQNIERAIAKFRAAGPGFAAAPRWPSG
jgi:hypothetical protein